jgi:hypothetical protein
MDRHSRLEMTRILVSGQWQGVSPHGNGWHSEAGLRGMVGLNERGDPVSYREGRSLLRRDIQ